MNKIMIVVLFVFSAMHEADASLIVYDNFGPGYTHDPHIGSAIGSSNPPAQLNTGFLFSPASSGYLSEFWAGISYVSGTPNLLTMWLQSDDGGVPGAVLETFDLDGQMPLFTQSGSDILHATAAGSTYLDQGESYWLVAGGAVVGSFSSWFNNVTGDIGARAYKILTSQSQQYPPFDTWDVTNDATLGALSIGVNPVPIPGALVLLLSGLTGLGLAGMGGQRLNTRCRAVRRQVTCQHRSNVTLSTRPV